MFKFEEDFWRHHFAVVTCVSFVCLCLCLPASSGVVHLFPNLFQVAPPSSLPLHVHYLEGILCTVDSFRLPCSLKLRREMVEESLCRDNSVQIISGCLPPSLQHYTAAENLLLTPAKKTLYKRPDKYWRILSQPTYARRTSTQLCVCTTVCVWYAGPTPRISAGETSLRRFRENTNTVLLFYCCNCSPVKPQEKVVCNISITARKL